MLIGNGYGWLFVVNLFLNEDGDECEVEWCESFYECMRRASGFSCKVSIFLDLTNKIRLLRLFIVR